MADKTGIEWTDATWNPIRGCSRVSEGCRNCYAEKTANRFRGPGQPYEGLLQILSPKWNGTIRFVEEHLLDPLKWKRPRRIFVNSMSDLFHENVTDEMLDRIFAVMALCPQHTFQVLTKRPGRMLAYLTDTCTEAGGLRIGEAASRLFHGTSLKDRRLSMAEQAGVSNKFEWKELTNVWLGVSVENQKAADERIPLLLQTPASVRFLSVEPLLGPVDLNALPRPFEFHQSPYGWMSWLARRLHWVIVGGESGPGARPMHPDWARSLRDECVAAGVPFFFKQWGEWGAGSVLMSTGEAVFRQFANFEQWAAKGNTWVGGGICLDADGRQMKNGGDMKAARYPVTVLHRVGKKAAGHLLDGVEWHQFPEAARG